MRLVVTNKEQDDLRVVVEPWGDFVRLKPGESIGVICSDEKDGYVDIDLSDAPSELKLWAEGNRDLQLRLDRGEALS